MGHISFWSRLICNFIGGKHKYHKEKSRSLIRLWLWGIGLEVNADKTPCVLLYRHQTAAQNRNIKITNGSSQKVATLKYLERE
jgi:hypothetical protein